MVGRLSRATLLKINAIYTVMSAFNRAAVPKAPVLDGHCARPLLCTLQAGQARRPVRVNRYRNDLPLPCPLCPR